MHNPETMVSGVNERSINMSGTDRFVLRDGDTDLFSVDSRDNTVRGPGVALVSDGVGNTTTAIHAIGVSFTALDIGRTIEFLAGPLAGRRVIVTSISGTDSAILNWTGAEPVAPGLIPFRLSGHPLVTTASARPGLLTNSIVDGATLTAAAAASAIPVANVVTLPANYWTVGRMWRIRAAGRISCVVTTPGTARFDVRFGATVVFDTLAIPLNIVAKVVVPWEFEALLTCRAVGATANLMGQARWLSEANINTAVPGTGPGPGGCLLPFDADPAVGANFNSTVTQAVDFFFTQTVATGSLTVHQYMIEQLN